MRSLVDAYFNAVYTVHANPPVSLRFAPGANSSAQPHAVFNEPWFIITACNPDSRPLSDSENAARNRALHADLLDRGHHPLRETSSDARGQWAEPGWLVQQAPREQALDLARRFAQRAVLFCERGKAGLLFPANERWIVAPLRS